MEAVVSLGGHYWHSLHVDVGRAERRTPAMLPLSSSWTLPSLTHTRLYILCSQKSQVTVQSLDGNFQRTRCAEHDHGKEGRRVFLLATLISSSQLFPVSASGKTKKKGPYDEKRLLDQNRFQVKVVTPESYVKSASGLIYLDIHVGEGECPKDGQQVTFHYVGYNESGRRIDSTYLQGAATKIRVGSKVLVPGFEEGIRDMTPGGKRRIIIPPELGPPAGLPHFSALNNWRFLM